MKRNRIAQAYIPSPPTGEREGPNAEHWEGEGERTEILARMLSRLHRRFPLTLTLPLAGPAGGEGIFAKGFAK